MKPLLALLTLALLLSGCAANDNGGRTSSGTGSATHAGTQADHAEIVLRDNRFEPTTLNVTAGASVHFANEGERRHTVTIHWVGDPADTTKLDEELQPEESVPYAFATPGTYHVWCELHGTMTGGMAMVVKAT